VRSYLSRLPRPSSEAQSCTQLVEPAHDSCALKQNANEVASRLAQFLAMARAVCCLLLCLKTTAFAPPLARFATLQRGVQQRLCNAVGHVRFFNTAVYSSGAAPANDLYNSNGDLNNNSETMRLFDTTIERDVADSDDDEVLQKRSKKIQILQTCCRLAVLACIKLLQTN
jgi:hypothetical protein